MPSVEPSDNLYVTGLPELDDSSLRQIFETVAPVAQCRMLPSKQPGMKRAAFVRFNDVETAAAVAESVNAGAVPMGLAEPVAAQFAPPPGKALPGAYGKASAESPARPSPYGFAAGGASGAAGGTSQDNLYVTLLPPDIDTWTLTQVFGQYGSVVQTRVLPPKLAGGKCAALVRYASHKEAAAVLQGFQAGTALQDFPEPICVKFADEYKGGPGKAFEQMALQPYNGSKSGSDTQQADNLYVTLLPADIDSPTLLQVFGQFGTVVSCKVLPPKIPGGKCAAFVRYATAEEASTVLQNWQSGNILQDFAEPIVMKFADQWPSGGTGVGKGAEGLASITSRGDFAPPSANLYVTLLPPDSDWELITRIFGQYGNVAQCKVLPCTQPGGKCAALVRYSSVEEALVVKEGLHGNIPSGLQEPVRVQFAAPAYGHSDEGKGSYGDRGKSGQGDGAGKGSPGQWEAEAEATQEFLADALVQGFEMSGRLPGGSKFSNDANTLYISGLPVDTGDLHLYRIFSAFGPIAVKGVRALKNPDGSCRGVGFVNFLTQDAAQAAISACHGAQLPDGNILKVQIKK